MVLRGKPPCFRAYRRDTNQTTRGNCTDKRITWASRPDENPALQVDPVTITHDGNYTCQIVTSDGVFHHEYHLQVLGKEHHIFWYFQLPDLGLKQISEFYVPGFKIEAFPLHFCSAPWSDPCSNWEGNCSVQGSCREAGCTDLLDPRGGLRHWAGAFLGQRHSDRPEHLPLGGPPCAERVLLRLPLGWQQESVHRAG